MKKLIFTLLISAALTGCGDELLDFRNAEMSNGLIYSQGENKPFTGGVTNIPLNSIPTKDLSGMLQFVTRVTNDQSLSQLFMVGSIASLMGNSSSSAIMCDALVKEGYLSGQAQCFTTSGRLGVMDVDYVDGNIDGGVVFYSLKDKTKSMLAEAEFTGGKLNGELKAYGLKSNKLVSSTIWVGGVLNGVAETFSDETQKLVWKATLVDDKLDGDVEEYDHSSGDLVKTTTYKSGVKVEPQSVSASKEGCYDSWMSAYRKEVGDEAAITSDQISEWEQWCIEGKTPEA